MYIFKIILCIFLNFSLSDLTSTAAFIFLQGGTARGSLLELSPETVYTKFLPVTEIQVRTIPTVHAHEPVALWELLHLKSASERRPEKIYHMSCR